MNKIHHGLATALSLATLGLALLPPALAAQQTEEEYGPPGRGFFQTGISQLDLDDLNAELVAAGFPALEDRHVSLGGAGYGMAGRFLIGAEGHALIGSAENTTDGSTRLRSTGGYGLLRVGYLVVSNDGLDVYPLVGIGGGSMNVKIVERSAPTFGEILADPERSSSLTNGMFLLDLGVAANYRVLIDDEEDEDDDIGGLVFGVQAGYTFAPGDPTWTLDEINGVAGGPVLRIQGLYVRLSIGGWGQERR